MRSALAATALGITLTVAALASCANPGEPGEPPGPEPSVTPVFASEEEALEAARDAYQAYLDVSNAVGQAGWMDTSAFESVERGEALDNELKTVSRYRASGWRLLGSSAFDSLSIQQINDFGAGSLDLVIYLCLDVSGVDVVDASGTSVVEPDRPERQALEVEMDDSEEVLKVSRSEAWFGDDFC